MKTFFMAVTFVACASAYFVNQLQTEELQTSTIPTPQIEAPEVKMPVIDTSNMPKVVVVKTSFNTVAQEMEKMVSLISYTVDGENINPATELETELTNKASNQYKKLQENIAWHKRHQFGEIHRAAFNPSFAEFKMKVVSDNARKVHTSLALYKSFVASNSFEDDAEKQAVQKILMKQFSTLQSQYQAILSMSKHAAKMRSKNQKYFAI